MTTSSTEPAADAATPHCPICNDLGFVRLDVPMDDPRFGRLQVCVCRQEAVEEAAHQRLYRLSNLAAFETRKNQVFPVSKEALFQRSHQGIDRGQVVGGIDHDGRLAGHQFDSRRPANFCQAAPHRRFRDLPSALA